MKIFEQNKPLEPGFEMVASPPSLSPPIRLAISRTRSSSSLYLSSSNPLSSGNLRELERPKLSSGVEMKDLSLTRLQKMEEKLPDENAWLETIPNFVEQLLSSSISDSSLLIPINDFFKAVLESISAYFQSENTAFHDQRFYCLRILLSMKPGDTWYYENYGKATSDDKLSKNYYVEGEVAKIPKTSFLDTSAPAGVSRLLIMNLNNFGASQGFHKFLSRIHKSDASPRYLASLSQVQEFLLLMRGWTRVARNRFKRSFFPSLQATTLLRLSHLTSLDLEELQTGCLRDKGKDIGSVDRVLKELDATLRAGNFGGYLWEGVEGTE